MDERVLTEHSGSPDTDSFPAVRPEDPAGPAEAPAPALPASPVPGSAPEAAAPHPAAPSPASAVAPDPVPPDPVAPDPVAPGSPAARPSRWYQLPYAIVLAGVLAGLAWAWQDTSQVRAGMVTVAAVLLAAALARLVLPERRAGLLATRHRLIDVATLLGLGVCILAMALVLPRSA